PCRATPPHFPKASRFYWPTVWRMEEGSSSKWRRTSRKRVAMFSKCWAAYIKLASVYQYDAEARAAQLSLQDPLRFHQQHSEPRTPARPNAVVSPTRLLI